jgi:2-amino-4-hydroxy-6-hydroxymethyldihydropteridine diphosphokinase
LGSNVGDRRAHLEFAAARLAAILRNIQVSSFLETEPVGVAEPQSAYLNAAVVGETALEPRDLLQALLAIEAERGRTRPYSRAPRTLDLDLILYGDRVVDGANLTLPHPRFRERRFVLEPLAEIAGLWIDPVTGRTVADLFANVN